MIGMPFGGVGIGLRTATAAVALSRPDVTFVEVIAESIDPGAMLAPALDAVQRSGRFVVAHGITLSLGGAERLDRRRLRHLAAVAERLDCPLVSEHVAFVRAGGREAGHLLPVPLTWDALDVVAANVAMAQAELPVPLALENPASLFQWPYAELDEADFLTELVDRTGCRLLVDLANLFVNSRNHGFDAWRWLERIPLEQLAYVHLAGGVDRDGLLHDTHTQPVWPEALDLLAHLGRLGESPALLLEQDDPTVAEAELHRELDEVARAAAVVG